MWTNTLTTEPLILYSSSEQSENEYPHVLYQKQHDVLVHTGSSKQWCRTSHNNEECQGCSALSEHTVKLHIHGCII